MKTIDEILKLADSEKDYASLGLRSDLYRYEDEARARILELELRLDLLENNTKILTHCP